MLKNICTFSWIFVIFYIRNPVKFVQWITWIVVLDLRPQRSTHHCINLSHAQCMKTMCVHLQSYIN